MKLLSFLLLLLSMSLRAVNVFPTTLLHDDHLIDMKDSKEPCLVALCVSKDPVKVEHAQDMQWGYRIAYLALCAFGPGAIAQIEPDSTLYEKISCSAFAALPPAILIGDLIWYGLKRYCIARND